MPVWTTLALWVLFLVVPQAFAEAPPILRVGVLEDAGNATHAAAREAFLDTLIRMARPEAAGPAPESARAAPPVVIPQGALCRVTAQEAASAAASLVRRDDLDVIIVSGLVQSQRLREAGASRALVLALGPDSDAAPDADNVRAFPGVLLAQRLLTLQAATGFSRLGILLGSQGAPTEGAMHTLLAALDAEAGSKPLPFAVFPYPDMPDSRTESCREAIDSLFFDAVDALLFDGSTCFDAARDDLAEHLDLLQGRGILPLALLDPTAGKSGALVSPWQGDSARLGRDVALAFLFSPPDGPLGAKLANLYPHIRKPVAPFRGSAPGYAMRLDVAEDIGFDPPPALLILTRAVLGRERSVRP